jgi:hypothetical protein
MRPGIWTLSRIDALLARKTYNSIDGVPACDGSRSSGYYVTVAQARFYFSTAYVSQGTSPFVAREPTRSTDIGISTITRSWQFTYYTTQSCGSVQSPGIPSHRLYYSKLESRHITRKKKTQHTRSHGKFRHLCRDMQIPVRCFAFYINCSRVTPRNSQALSPSSLASVTLFQHVPSHASVVKGK